MRINIDKRRHIEGYRPGMDARDTVTVIGPSRSFEITLGGLLAQMPFLELPDTDADRDE